MYVSSIPVMCYYNGHIVRTDNDVKYDGNKASTVPLEIPIDCTFEQLSDIIFASTPIDKRKFNLVLKCKYPLKWKFDLLRSLRLVGRYICTCCILGRPPRTKETLPDFH